MYWFLKALKYTKKIDESRVICKICSGCIKENFFFKKKKQELSDISFEFLDKNTDIFWFCDLCKSFKKRLKEVHDLTPSSQKKSRKNLLKVKEMTTQKTLWNKGEEKNGKLKCTENDAKLFDITSHR